MPPSTGCDASSVVAAIDEMQTLAEREDWTAVRSSLDDLRKLVQSVPANERRAVLLAAHRCVEGIRQAALDKCSETSAQLVAVKAGRRGADRYQETSQLTQR